MQARTQLWVLTREEKVQRFSTMKPAFTVETAAPVGRQATSEFRFDDIAGRFLAGACRFAD
jgi:hypothetical protein